MPTLKGLATLLFGGLVDRYSNLFIFVKNSLPKADIKIPFRTYMSTVFFVSSVVFLTCLIALVLVLQIIKVLLVQKIIYLIFVPVTAGIVSFVMLTFYPLQRMSSRRKNIESNLPFVLTHMAAITEAGIPPSVVFKLVGEFEEYGEISKEIKKISNNIEVYGIDPLTAIKQVASKTPSEEFKQVLLGFATTTESGGNIKAYLKNAGQEALFQWRTKRERFLSQLSTFAEIYTGILIAAPLFIIALLSVMGMVQPAIGGFDIPTLMKLSVYLVVPIMNAGFLVFLRGIEVEM